LKVILAGFPFELAPAQDFSAADREALGLLARFPDAIVNDPVFELRISKVPPWERSDTSLFPEGAPAVVQCEQGRVRLSHSTFIAELEPLVHRGSLFRMTREAFPIELSLRTALCCRLPLAGGLPLHAAGLAAEGRGLVFFGPSGAGKSTLAGLSPYPVLSDELVAITPTQEGFELRSTGFWGTLDGDGVAYEALPLAALFALEKGPDFLLERLDRKEAFRRLLEVVVVPRAPVLWRPAMVVLNRLVTVAPVYRMVWSPAKHPWRELQELWTGSV